MSELTELYRYFDDKGRLLYVGISKSAITRQSQHSKHSDWYSLAVMSTIERFNSRNEAIKAEKKAIKEENPLFNIIHSRINKQHRPKKSNKYLHEVDTKRKVNIDYFNFKAKMTHGVLILFNEKNELLETISTNSPLNNLKNHSHDSACFVRSYSRDSAEHLCKWIAYNYKAINCYEKDGDNIAITTLFSYEEIDNIYDWVDCFGDIDHDISGINNDFLINKTVVAKVNNMIDSYNEREKVK